MVATANAQQSKCPFAHIAKTELDSISLDVDKKPPVTTAANLHVQQLKCPFTHNNATNGFDTISPEVLRDQVAAFDEMLQKCPVAKNDDGKGYTVFSHADVNT
eukprot:Awhi_evm2s13347